MLAKPLSVIITAYNQGSSLNLLLASLAAQTERDQAEILVCDDGSAEDLRGICEKNAVDFSLDIKYVWQPREGSRVCRSKNNAIRCAQGDWLVFLDADIVVGQGFLGAHRAAHAREKQIVCNPRKWFGLRADARGGISSLERLCREEGVGAVLRELEENSEDFGDRYQQRVHSGTRTAWMACLGFSFSVDRRAEVLFDENFRGWGPEDRELGLRLMARHGYELVYRDDIEVFHLESCSTGRTAFEFLPADHAGIVPMLRNLLHFSRAHRDQDLSVLMELVLHYELDGSSGQWRLSPKVRLSEAADLRARIGARLDEIELWLRERGEEASVVRQAE